jgi:hypothetical protein
MWYIITFVLGTWFGVTIAACLVAAKDKDSVEV